MLVTHPKVMDAAVFGIPDDEMGQTRQGCRADGRSGRRHRRVRRRAAGLAARSPGALQVSALDLVRGAAAPDRHRQAVQAGADSEVLAIGETVTMRGHERRALLRRTRGWPGLRLGAVDDADGRGGRRAPGDLGDRLRLPLDAASVDTRSPVRRPRSPIRGLVCDVAIGQTTLATQRVKANLFYRGLVFHRFPIIGDTLFTRTEVVGLKQNSAKAGRAPTGLAALRMTTIDQIGQAGARLLPLRHAAAARRRRRHRPRRRHVGDRDGLGTPTDPTAEWDADAFRARVPGSRTSTPAWPDRCCTAPPTSSAAPPN